MNSDDTSKRPQAGKLLSIEAPLTADESAPDGIGERIRAPLSELVDKCATLADSLLPAEHKRLAEEAFEAGQAILDSVQESAEVEPPAPLPAEDLETGPSRVLLIAPDRVEQRVLAGYLAVEGLECTAVKDGKEALLALEAENFETLILEVDLANSASAFFLEALRDGSGADCWAELPILLLGDDETRLRELVIEWRADGLLARPLGQDDLARRLLPLIER